MKVANFLPVDIDGTELFWCKGLWAERETDHLMTFLKQQCADIIIEGQSNTHTHIYIYNCTRKYNL